MKIRPTGSCLFLAALCSGLLPAQMTITGTVTGTVVDPSGQVIAGAKIVLTSPKRGDSRSAVANEVGAFSLNAVQPDTYTLRVQHGGFKAYERKELVVSANERISTGDIALQIGDVLETVSVVAETAQLQTDSSEHSAVLTTSQMGNLTAPGPEGVSMLRTIP